MTGAKKIVSDLKDLKILFNNLGEVITDPRPVIYDLLKEYNVVEIHRKGSPLHTKAGLSFDKVLVKAYNKRQGATKNEDTEGQPLNVTVVQVTPVTEVTVPEDKRRLQIE